VGERARWRSHTAEHSENSLPGVSVRMIRAEPVCALRFDADVLAREDSDECNDGFAPPLCASPRGRGGGVQKGAGCPSPLVRVSMPDGAATYVPSFSATSAWSVRGRGVCLRQPSPRVSRWWMPTPMPQKCFFISPQKESSKIFVEF